MFRVCHYQPGKEQSLSFSEQLPGQWPPPADQQVWIDVGLADQDERQLLLQLGIDPLVVEDIQHPRKPPKLEYHADYTFVLLRGLDAQTDSRTLKTIQIAFLMGDNWLITCHRGRSRSVEETWQQLQGYQQPLQALQQARAVMQRIQDRYVPMLMELESRLGEVEEDLAEHADDRLLTELTGYKTRLRRLKRTFTYHERIFSQWREDVEEELGQTERSLLRLYETAERLHSLASLYYDWVGDLSEGYLSLSSHRLNNIMKVLTVITAIFVPLSFLAGLYGMNFDNIPELHHPYGYFILLGVMVAVVTCQLWWFRRSRWL
ncbi:magnesium transporter CorA family protein [Balneatrix alpica]|uniref:Magnesium transporter CorA family protein n=1 Tax=Balneatrix alpica TaxID=75684 RepID=A0ABV5ZEZ5_9GAMM|nr:magnesium transporter CorA family protein [Balneatrix alpica]